MSIELQFGKATVLDLDNDRRAILERLGLFEILGSYSRIAVSGLQRIDSGTPATLGGLSASVTPTRAVRAIVTADLDVLCHAWTTIADYFVVELLVNGTPVTEQLVWANLAVDERISLGRSWTVDLAANVATTLELQGSVAGGATNSYDVKDASGLIVQLGIML